MLWLPGKLLKTCLVLAVLLTGACGVADHLNYAVVFEGEDYGESFHIRAAYLPITGLTKEETVKLALLRAAYVTKDKGYRYFYASGAVRISRFYVVNFIFPSELNSQDIRILFHATNKLDPDKKNFFETQKVIDSKEIQALR